MAQHNRLNTPSRIRLLCTGAAIILLGFIAIAAYSVVDSWRTTRLAAEQSSRNLAGALAQDIDRNITLYDLSLQTVVAEMKLPQVAAMTPEMRGATLFDGATSADDLGAIFVIDQTGNVIAQSRATGSHENYAQRDYFVAQRDHADTGLYIGAPYRTPTANQWAIAFSRRISRADGSFGGIVFGSIKLDYFRRLFDRLDLGPNGGVSLLRADGTILMRNPFTESFFGRVVPNFDHYLSSPSGAFLVKGQLDGVRRLIVYQKIDNLPLIISVTPTTQTIFAQWRRKATLTMLLVLGLAATAAWLVFWLVSEVRHRAEAEALLRDAVDSISEGFVIFDADDRFVMCNAAYKQLYAPVAAELTPGTPFDHILRTAIERAVGEPLEAQHEAWIAERLRDHRNPPPQPIERKLWDGRWILEAERRMTNGGSAGLKINITALKKTQQALHDSEKRLERAQRIAGIGDVEHDVVSRAVTWSEQAFRIYGIDNQRVPPWNEFLELVHPEDRTYLVDAVDQMRRGEAAPNLEYRIIRPDGQVRYLLRENEPVRDASGQVLRVASTVQDITELRQSQERERELQFQLQHRQKIEALGTLAGGIAHDMNNTLVPILALSKRAMTQAVSGSRERDNLEIVYHAAEHARDLVKQILAFSRKETIEKKPVHLGPIAHNALHMMRAGLPTTIALTEHIDDLPVVEGDEGQIRQVIINLVTNAAQAIGDQPGAITLSVKRSDKQVHLSVRDTGCGIDEQHLSRLFDPFFTTKEAGQGTGLGLSVVHGIVNAHGGRIEVRSTPGQGSTFVVSFPAVAAAENAVSSAA